MRRKSSPRVVGPYLERGKWRIVVVENNARKSHFFLSEKEALKHKAGLAKEVAPPPSRKLADMLAEWAATRVRNGTCKPLFGLSEKTHRPRPRQSLFKMVREICQRARVPRVCTHSLRGLWATLAVGSGVASHAVAASLGHHSFAMTQKHYAQPAAIVNAGTARVASVLDGGGGLPSLSARDLLRQLDPETLAELAQLLAADKGKGDASN